MDEEKGFVQGEVLHDRVETRFVTLPSWTWKSWRSKPQAEAGGDGESHSRPVLAFQRGPVIRFN